MGSPAFPRGRDEKQKREKDGQSRKQSGRHMILRSNRLDLVTGKMRGSLFHEGLQPEMMILG